MLCCVGGPGNWGGWLYRGVSRTSALRGLRLNWLASMSGGGDSGTEASNSPSIIQTFSFYDDNPEYPPAVEEQEDPASESVLLPAYTRPIYDQFSCMKNALKCLFTNQLLYQDCS